MPITDINLNSGMTSIQQEEGYQVADENKKKLNEPSKSVMQNYQPQLQL